MRLIALYLLQTPQPPGCLCATSLALCAIPVRVSCGGCPHPGLLTLPGVCARVPRVPAGTQRGHSVGTVTVGTVAVGTVASMVSVIASTQWPVAQRPWLQHHTWHSPCQSHPIPGLEQGCPLCDTQLFPRGISSFPSLCAAHPGGFVSTARFKCLISL